MALDRSGCFDEAEGRSRQEIFDSLKTPRLAMEALAPARAFKGNFFVSDIVLRICAMSSPGNLWSYIAPYAITQERLEAGLKQVNDRINHLWEEGSFVNDKVRSQVQSQITIAEALAYGLGESAQDIVRGVRAMFSLRCQNICSMKNEEDIKNALVLLRENNYDLMLQDVWDKGAQIFSTNLERLVQLFIEEGLLREVDLKNEPFSKAICCAEKIWRHRRLERCDGKKVAQIMTYYFEKEATLLADIKVAFNQRRALRKAAGADVAQVIQSCLKDSIPLKGKNVMSVLQVLPMVEHSKFCVAVQSLFSLKNLYSTWEGVLPKMRCVRSRVVLIEDMILYERYSLRMVKKKGWTFL